MSDETTVVHDDENSDWKLLVRESNRTGEVIIQAAKPIPYDGVLYLSSEERKHVSYRKNSTFNLDVSEVIDRYEDKTGADIRTCNMCSWPVGTQDRDDYRARSFCSIECETKWNHVKDDARDARAAVEGPR